MLRLLIIDDSLDDRLLLMRNLQQAFADLEVEQAAEADQFQRALEKGNFDLVITDYELGWSNGLAILTTIKTHYPACPVIMFTNSGSEEIAVAAMKAGLEDYIIKSPKQYARLPIAIRSALRRLENQQAMQQLTVQKSALFQEVQRLNASLEQQVKERTQQLQQAFEFEETLKRITDKVRDSLDEAQILQTAVRELAIVVGVSCCNAAIYDIEHRTSTIFYEYTTSASVLQGRVLKMAKFPEGYQQLLAGQYFQFCSLMPNPHRGRTAMLACPIMGEREALGDLWLIHESNYVFSDQDVRLVQQVANQCAIALRQSRLFQAAQAQVAELERLNQLKNDFLSTVSHELRTPIANMKMAIYMLEKSITEDRRQRYLNILKTECERESELIHDLLDLQRLEAASYPTFLFEAIQLQDWLPSLITPFQSRALEHEQTLHLKLPDALPAIISDRTSLERVLVELLHNACKYTCSGGQIILSADFTTTPIPEFILIVKNQAEIPEVALPHIFEKFYRVPKADPWQQGGTGLGLALVQNLVEKLQGTIQAESVAGWTTFTLQLPAKPLG